MVTPRQLVILGGPGDGLVVAETAKLAAAAGAPYQLSGFLNDVLPCGTVVHGVPVLGTLEDWCKLSDAYVFCPAIQKVMDMPRRARRIDALSIPHERWTTVIHPLSAIADDVQIGAGCFIASFVTIQPSSSLGDFASIRAGGMLGHHAAVGRHAYIGPNATMCGRTTLAEGAHLGPNAVLLDNKTVGRFAVVGIGAAVTKDVLDFAVVMGNPARRIGRVGASPLEEVRADTR